MQGRAESCLRGDAGVARRLFSQGVPGSAGGCGAQDTSDSSSGSWQVVAGLPGLLRRVTGRPTPLPGDSSARPGGGQPSPLFLRSQRRRPRRLAPGRRGDAAAQLSRRCGLGSQLRRCARSCCLLPGNGLPTAPRRARAPSPADAGAAVT